MRERLRFIVTLLGAGLLVLPAPTATAAFTILDGGNGGGTVASNGVPFCLTVTNAFGHVVPGATVTLKAKGPLLGLAAAPITNSTDADGKIFHVLPPAQYQVSITDPFAWYGPDAFERKLLPGDDHCAEPVARSLAEVTGLGYVSGRAVDGSFTNADGEPLPLPDVAVTFTRDVGDEDVALAPVRERYEVLAAAAGVPGWENDVRYRFAAVTGDEGRFLLACPPASGPAALEVRFSAATPHESVAIASATLADACGGNGIGSLGDVPLVRSPVHVTGFVRSANGGASLAGAEVTASFASTDTTTFLETGEPFVLENVTGDDGAYALALPWRSADESGGWTLVTTRAGFGSDTAKPILPAPGTVETDFELEPPELVSVTPRVRAYTPLHEIAETGERSAAGVTVCLNNTATPHATPTCWVTDANGEPPTGCVALHEGEYEVALTGDAWIGRVFTLVLEGAKTGDCATDDPFATLEGGLLFPAGTGAVRGRVEDAVARARLDAGLQIDDAGVPFFNVTSAGGDACRTLVNGSFDCLLELGGGGTVTFQPAETDPLYVQQTRASALVAGTVTELEPVILARTQQALTVNLSTTFPNGTLAPPPQSSHADVRTWHSDFGERACTKGLVGEGFVHYACSAAASTRWDANPTFTFDDSTVTRDWGAPGFQVNVSQPKGGIVYAPQSCANLPVVPADPVIECAIKADGGARTLTGRVLDAHDGRAVEGATVEAWNPLTGAKIDAGVCNADAYSCSNETDENGTFTLNVPAFPDVVAFCFKVSDHEDYQDLTPAADAECSDVSMELSVLRESVNVDVAVKDAHSGAPLSGTDVTATTASKALCDASAAFVCEATTPGNGVARLKLPWGMPFTLRTGAFEGTVTYTAAAMLDVSGDARVPLPASALTRVSDASTWLPTERAVDTVVGESVATELLAARAAVDITGTAVMDGPAPDADAPTRVMAFPRWQAEDVDARDFCAPAETDSPDAPEYVGCAEPIDAEAGGEFVVSVPVSNVRASVPMNDPDKPWTLTATREGYYAASSPPTAGGEVGEITLRSTHGPTQTLRFLVRDVADAPLDDEIVWVCIRHLEGPLHATDRPAELAALGATAELATGPDAEARAGAAAERCQYGYDVTFAVEWTRATEANDARTENAFAFIVDATGHVPVTGVVEVTTASDEENVEVVRMTPTKPGLFACVGGGPELCPAAVSARAVTPVDAVARWVDRAGVDASAARGAWLVQPPQLTSRATVDAGASRVDLGAYAGQAADGTWSFTFVPTDPASANAVDGFRVTVTFVGTDGPFACTMEGSALGAGQAYPLTWSFTVDDGGCTTLASTVTNDGAARVEPDEVPRVRFFADLAAFGEV